jgi:hypothetical protein
VDEGLFGGAGGAPLVEEGLEGVVEGGGVFDFEDEEGDRKESVVVGITGGFLFAFLGFGAFGFGAVTAGGFLLSDGAFAFVICFRMRFVHGISPDSGVQPEVSGPGLLRNASCG